MAVEGDACGMESASRTYGGHATTAHAQTQAFGGALNALPTTSFTGGKADASRAFAGQLQAASGRAAQAYDRVASFLPRVATAVQHSQQAEKALIKAKAELVAAVADVAKATAALAAAETVVAAKKAAGAVTSIVGVHVAPSAGELAAVASAKQHLTQAQHKEEQAQRAERTASNHFQDAEQARQSVLNAFTALCQQESAALGGAIPTPPPSTGGFLAALGNPLFIVQNSQMSTLRGEAKTLADMPRILQILERANPTNDLTGVQAALRHGQYGALESVLPPPPAPAPPKKKPEHHSLFSLHTVEHAAGDVAKTVVDVHKFVLHQEGQFIAGVGDTAAGLAKATYTLAKMDAPLAMALMGHPDPAAVLRALKENYNVGKYTVTHLPELAKNVVNLPLLEHNPARWAGQIAPDVVAAVYTGGESKVAEVSAESATKARAAYHAAMHHDRETIGSDTATPALKKLNEAKATRTAAQDVEKRNTTVDRTRNGVVLNGILSEEAKPEECEPYHGEPFAPSYAAGKATEHVVVHHGRVPIP